MQLQQIEAGPRGAVGGVHELLLDLLEVVDGELALDPRTDPTFFLRYLGEAAPAGGLGIARQIKDEIADCPPTCVVIARAADRWLAAYAQVDQTLVAPLDPVTTGQTVAAMLRARRDGAIPLGTMGTLG